MLDGPYTYISEWWNSREWDLYRFSSPVVALAIQLASRPFKKGLAAEHDRRLAEVGITDSVQRGLFLRIAKDWDLRSSCLATGVTTFFSVAAITHAFSSSGSGALFAAIMSVLVLVAIVNYPQVFQGPIGRVSTPLTDAGAKTKLDKWLKKRDWTYADFYSNLLRLLNLLLIILILLTMPRKQS